MLANRLNGARQVPGRHTRVTGLDHVDKLVRVDQSPIGRTPRSNPATYTGVFDKIRTLFAATTEAKVRGYQPGRFSFNVKGGRCEACTGDGTIKIEMNFLPDVYVPCEVCHGARYNRETLEVHYKGKTISEVLDMSIEEAAEFFQPITGIHRYLQTLVDVGLGYVRLGQPAPTLSGGEAQRVKLASELQKRSTGRTVYILDEPTTGLHFEDIRKLLDVINGLVDKGNTVIVIEHNLDVIKTSDWVIDMGPEGGAGGGTIVAEGTPEDIAAVPESYTGKFLAEALGAAATGRPHSVGQAAQGQRLNRPRGSALSCRRASIREFGPAGRRPHAAGPRTAPRRRGPPGSRHPIRLRRLMFRSGSRSCRGPSRTSAHPSSCSPGRRRTRQRESSGSSGTVPRYLSARPARRAEPEPTRAARRTATRSAAPRGCPVGRPARAAPRRKHCSRTASRACPAGRRSRS